MLVGSVLWATSKIVRDLSLQISELKRESLKDKYELESRLLVKIRDVEIELQKQHQNTREEILSLLNTSQSLLSERYSSLNTQIETQMVSYEHINDHYALLTTQLNEKIDHKFARILDMINAIKHALENQGINYDDISGR